MVKIAPYERPTLAEILQKELILRFLLSKAIQGKFKEERLGKKFSKYLKEYREVKPLSNVVMLVEQVATRQLFVAKKQNGLMNYLNAKEELLMLEKLKHKNIVRYVESFHSPSDD